MDSLQIQGFWKAGGEADICLPPPLIQIRGESKCDASRKKERKKNRKNWTLSIFASLICAEYVIASSPETLTSGLAYNA